MAEDAQRLLSLQLAYERELEHNFSFAGLSVNDFITRLLIEGFGKRAERVRVDWKVGDKRSVGFASASHGISIAIANMEMFRWWWLKLKALAVNKDWEGLETFAKSKKSPIGYEPFVVRPPLGLITSQRSFSSAIPTIHSVQSCPPNDLRSPVHMADSSFTESPPFPHPATTDKSGNLRPKM